MLSIVVTHWRTVAKTRLQSRQRSISAYDTQTSFGDIFDAVAAAELHAALELQVERLKH
jgi:hypothetical protein